jgi:hypothetical protein
MENRRCKLEGCSNLGEVNKRPNGKVYRRPLCSTHKRKKYNKLANNRRERIDKFKKQNGNSCKLCGWIGPCDVHRIVPGAQGGWYTAGNMILICPNCHRLQHTGKLNIENGSLINNYAN